MDDNLFYGTIEDNLEAMEFEIKLIMTELDKTRKEGIRRNTSEIVLSLDDILIDITDTLTHLRKRMIP